ncbi:MAG: PAS domain S-box protein [Anaerolineales bacterium]|nr:PAS domain S-box protein [Anaerolineales bacterium]
MLENLRTYLSRRFEPEPGEDSEAQRQAALFRLSADLAAALDERDVCQRVVVGLHDTLGYDFVAFFLVEESTGDRVMIASVGFVDPPVRLKAGEGLSELAFLDGQLRYTPHVNQEPGYFYGMGGSEVDVPVRIGGEVTGVLIAESKQRADFGPKDFEILTAASQQAGLAIEKNRLITVERRRADELEALRATLTELTAELELQVLLRAIVERASVLLNGAGGELGLYDDIGREVEIVVSYGFSQNYIKTSHLLGEGAMGLVAETGEPLILDDYLTWEGRAHHYDQDEIHAIVAVPLHLGKRLIGVITVVAADEARKFSDRDVNLLNLFAQQAAIAIENASLFEKAQKEIAARDRAEEELRRYQEHLEERVAERTLELQKSEESYRNLFNGVPVGLYRTTPAGEIMDANPGLIQMLGYPDKDSLLAEKASSMYMKAEERTSIQAVLEQKGIVRDVEFQLKRYDGQIIWVTNTARVVKDESGLVLYYEGSMEDVSERKQADFNLQNYQEQLEELVAERTSELQTSEQRYRTLFDGVPVGLYRSTPEGKVLDFNLAAVQMLGFPNREAVLALDHTSDWYVDPEDQFRWRSAMELGGAVRDFPIQMRRYDGGVIWVNDSAHVVRDDTGQVLYFEGRLEDITDRRRFEEQIQQQKEYFEALFVNNPVAVVTADIDGVVVSWNPMAEQLFGYSQDEAVGEFLDNLVAKHDSVRKEALGYTNQVLGLDRVQVATRRTKKDGSLVDVDLLALPIIVSDEILGFIAIYYDLTERIRFEQQILQQKEYFEALFVNSPVAVLTVDLEAKIISWNPMAEQLFGYSQQEAIGEHLDDIVADHPEIRTEALDYTQQLMTAGRFQATTKRTRKDGSLVEVEVLALPVIVGDQKVGYIGIYVDISELKNAQNEAEAANQAKSLFLANMSHELRTPLNAILGFTQLMERDPHLIQEHQESLKVINRSSEHLLGLINEVLEMSKIEAGHLTLREKVFDLYDLLYGLEEMFDLRAAEKGLSLLFHWADDLPRHVFADEGKLRQILSNLLGNAVKFTQNGEITLRVSCPSREREGVRLFFEVQDTGPGIASEELAIVFEPFVQSSIGQRFQEGTGLGLAISRQYVNLMGGEIEVHSEINQGSLFKFEILVDLESEVDLDEGARRQRVLGLEAGQPEYRILIAEDHHPSRRLLVKMLQDKGFVLRQAANGQEAIQIWERWDPDLIWMDMRMPEMDGFAAVQYIRAQAKGQDTRIIALTASAFEEERERVMLSGCDDFVRKPFQEAEIFNMLIKYLDARFIFEDLEARPATKIKAAAIITPTNLAALPAELITELQQATTTADMDRMLGAVEQIALHNQELAAQLKNLIQDFEYKQVLKLIEASGDEA